MYIRIFKNSYEKCFYFFKLYFYIFINRWMDNRNIVYLYNRILLSYEENLSYKKNGWNYKILY